MSEATTIDRLSIEITSDSTSAAKGIEALARSLGELKTNGSIGVAVKNLNKLSSALRSFTNTSAVARTLGILAKAMGEMKTVGSVSTIGTSVKRLGESLKTLDGVNIDGVAPKIRAIADAVRPLSEVKAGGLNTMINGLKKLDEVTDKLDDATITRFAQRIEKLNTVLGPLSTKMTTIQTGLRGLNTRSRTAGDGVGHLGKKVNTTTLNMASMVTVIQGAVSALMPFVRLLSDSISAAIEWDGIAARFGRGFGGQAEDVYGWVQRLNEELGINTQQFMQYSSTYATMLTGFGVAMEDASKMALGYTELTYDIWAGYNDIYKRYSDAADAVRSAIAGEVEPIRRAGFTIVESTLEQTAANYGLEISLEKATEAQKSYLRYLTLVDQAHAQNLVGTYAKEMNTAEGVMRTFSQQLKSLTQAFGSLFLPILVKVMPYLQAFVELLTDAIHAVAAFFGITIQGVDWSGYGDGLGGLGDSADDAADAVNGTTQAIKDLKNATIGIDELNVISPPSKSGGSGSGGGVGGNGFEGLDVDSLWDDSIFDSIQFQVDDIRGKLEEALTVITAVISGFLLAIGTILVVSGANIPLGLGLMAVGAIGLVATIAENWNGMSEQLAKTLTVVTSVLGGFLLAIGAFLAFSGVNVGLGAALMVAGAVALGTAVTINWKFLEGDLKSTLSILTGIVAGGLLAMGALFAFTGVSPGLGIALMVAGAVSLATAAGLNWEAMSEPLRKAIGTLEAIVGGALLTFGAILAFTGVNIPLGVGLIAAGAVSLVSATALNWESLTSDLKNTISTITALVSGALIGVGAILAFSGVATPLGIGMIAAGAVGIIATASLNWSYLTEKIKNVLKEIGAAVGIALLAVGAVLAFTGVALPLGIALMAVGAASLIGAVALNWDSIVSAVKNVLKKIGIAAGAAMLALGVLLVCTGVGIPVGIALIAAGAASLTAGVALNWDSISEKIKSIFGKIKEWLNRNGLLVLGIILCLTGAGIPLGVNLIKKSKSGETVSSLGNGLLDTIKTKWNEVKNWWNNGRGKLSTYTPSIGSIRDKLSSAWSSAKTWWSKSKGSLSYTPSIGDIKSKLQSAWNTAKNWWNRNVKLSIPSLSFKVTYTTSGLGTVKKAIVNALGLQGWPKLSFAANGGIFDAGSLIWAGERGAEIVANAGGGKTGVMNVDQMQEAVYEGVYSAVMAAMRAGTGNGNNRPVNVVLPDGRVLASYVEKTQRERGASIMGSQVYSY